MGVLGTTSVKRARRRGAIVFLAALCLIIVVAFLAFSIDLGYIVATESALQNAADAGALSAARALPNGRQAAVAAAQLWAGKNLAAGEAVDLVADEDVEIGWWNSSDATFQVLPANSPKSPNAVRVTCRRTAARGNPLKLFFAPLRETDLAASAIAMHSGGSCGGIMALNRVYLREDSYTDSFDSTEADYYDGPAGDNGDVCTNGHVRLIGNAGINGDAHPGPDEDGVEMGATNYVTGDTSVLDDYIDFPPVVLGDVATSNDNGQVPLSNGGADAYNGGAFSLDGGDSLDLPPGTYYFSSLTLKNGSLVRVSGPTYIYIDGNVNLTDGGIVNQTLQPMNLQIYPLGDALWLPDNIDLYAAIYSTTSAIEKAGGSGGFFGKMVGQKIKINGSGGLHVDESLVFGDLESGGEQLGMSTGAALVY